jgi:hypothetical protein
MMLRKIAPVLLFCLSGSVFAQQIVPVDISGQAFQHKFMVVQSVSYTTSPSTPPFKYMVEGWGYVNSASNVQTLSIIQMEFDSLSGPCLQAANQMGSHAALFRKVSPTSVMMPNLRFFGTAGTGSQRLDFPNNMKIFRFKNGNNVGCQVNYSNPSCTTAGVCQF